MFQSVIGVQQTIVGDNNQAIEWDEEEETNGRRVWRRRPKRNDAMRSCCFKLQASSLPLPVLELGLQPCRPLHLFARIRFLPTTCQ
jgi:hypothetical protein